MYGIFACEGLHSIQAVSLWLIRDISEDDVFLNFVHIVWRIFCSASVSVAVSGCSDVFNTIPSFSPIMRCS